MRKVVIATLHFYNNCGSDLQAHALRRTLEKLWYLAHILPYRPRLPEYIYFQDPTLQRAYAEKCARFADFHHRVLGMGEDADRIGEGWKDYDAYIVGRDIVWDRKFSRLDSAYFLAFAPEESRKVAYTASVLLTENGRTEDDSLFAARFPVSERPAGCGVSRGSEWLAGWEYAVHAPERLKQEGFKNTVLLITSDRFRTIMGELDSWPELAEVSHASYPQLLTTCTPDSEEFFRRHVLEECLRKYGSVLEQREETANKASLQTCLRGQENVLGVLLITNSTIQPNGSVFELLRDPQFFIEVSDYGHIQQMSRTVAALESAGARFSVLTDQVWDDMGGVEPRGRTAEQRRKVYRSCEQSRLMKSIHNDAVYTCARGARMRTLVCDYHSEQDYFTLNEDKPTEHLREKIASCITRTTRTPVTAAIYDCFLLGKFRSGCSCLGIGSAPAIRWSSGVSMRL